MLLSVTATCAGEVSAFICHLSLSLVFIYHSYHLEFFLFACHYKISAFYLRSLVMFLFLGGCSVLFLFGFAYTLYLCK